MRKYAPPIAAAAAVIAILFTVTLAATDPITLANVALPALQAVPDLAVYTFNEIRDGVMNTVTGLVTVYDAPGNAGILVANLGGFEWRGTPGLFVCGDQC
ncbi:hypothetical protein [Amycolatopsis sp. WAC 04197]|uniref:hypothetical protein n=1 Tax=Amycolatopsis sp. WAC 04197 TaxID=2203199 RepID=UPI000F7A6C91|nr:hypothetical protein [Amycolatopsis sp. WAC 04197]